MMNPTLAKPEMLFRAGGLQDQDSLVKRKDGLVPFALNYSASSDAWARRAGRSWSLQESGAVLALMQLEWMDGSSNDIALIGGVLYDLSSSVTYLVAAGKRLLLQSADGSWWDITPDPNTGIISPTVVAAPTAAVQTASITVQMGQSFGFSITGASIHLSVSETTGMWYTSSEQPGDGITNYTDDVAFANTGFALIEKDNRGNSWKFKITDEGVLYVETI